jgi:endonuclease YncB( thermonuclease family)
MGNTGRRQPRFGARWRRGSVAFGLAAVLVPAAAGPGRGADPNPPAACRLAAFSTGRAREIVDGRTFILTDGREVRLAGIETPSPGDAEPGPGMASRAALAALIGDNDLVLKHLIPASDRYGRIVAAAFVGEGTSETSLAHALVSRGHARVALRPGEAGCYRELLAAERTARAAKLGVWGDPRYELKRAENPAEVLAVRGRYTLVEGKVLSVRESGGTIYVNFGRRWTDDFTVTISKRNERAFNAAGLAPQRLQGRRVIVRGYVEERGGPWIEALRPEQIEVVDGH